ncbi:MAG: ABC transporter permease [Acidimicrobiales bacterium]
MRALAIARASSRRVLRDRVSLFFLIVLPIVVIVIVGAVAQGFNTFRVGVVNLDGTQASRQLVAELSHASGLAVVAYPNLASLDKAVGRSEISAGVLVPRGLAAGMVGGRAVTVSVIAEQANNTQQAAATRVTSVVDGFGGRVEAAQFATRYAGSFAENLARAGSLSSSTPGVGLRAQVVHTAQGSLPPGYEYSAPTELVLFVFLMAIAGGATIVETRRLGMFERMSAAPVRPRTIIAGESITYIVIAAVQSAVIVVIGTVVFGVSWGNPLAAAVLLVLWCLVGASAGMVAGTVFRTPEQASAMGPIVGIVFAMLGGCMWPLSIVSTTMREIGHATPQAWAVDAWTNLLSNHGDLASISHEIGILALFALGFFALATFRLKAMLAARGA